MRLIPKERQESKINDMCKDTPYSFIGWNGQYKGVRTKAILRCEKHGEWLIYVPDFFKGVRCAACKGVKAYSQEQAERLIIETCQRKPFSFIKWKSGYKNSKSRAVFNCSQHGEWDCIYTSITNSNSGCPACSKNGYDCTRYGYLYCLESDDKTLMKIGITNQLKRRVTELRRVTPFGFTLKCYYGSKDGQLVKSLETAFHEHFKSAETKGFNGATEWLRWDKNIPLWFDYF